MVIAIFILGVVFLAIFAYLDIKKGEVENEYVAWMAVVGIMLAIWQHYVSYNLIFSCLLLFLFGLTLWKLNIVGGADVKILATLPLFMPYTSDLLLYKALLFIIILTIVVVVTGMIAQRFKKEHIPMIPAILIAYVISSLT